MSITLNLSTNRILDYCLSILGDRLTCTKCIGVLHLHKNQ